MQLSPYFKSAYTYWCHRIIGHCMKGGEKVTYQRCWSLTAICLHGTVTCMFQFYLHASHSLHVRSSEFFLMKQFVSCTNNNLKLFAKKYFSRSQQHDSQLQATGLSLWMHHLCWQAAPRGQHLSFVLF